MPSRLIPATPQRTRLRPAARATTKTPRTPLTPQTSPPTEAAAAPSAVSSALLLALPGLLQHPPTHPLHVPSLYLSLLALRKCLGMHTDGVEILSPEMECRAWTFLAETGMKVIGAGLSAKEGGLPWAQGIEAEVERAVGKGLLLSQKHHALRAYKTHLTLLHSHLALWQHNLKFSRSLLRRLCSSMTLSDPPHMRYTALLTLHGNLLSTAHSSPADLQAALQTVQTLRSLAVTWKHQSVIDLADVIRLRTLVVGGKWNEVGVNIAEVEKALGLVEFSNAPTPLESPAPGRPAKESQPLPENAEAVASPVVEPDSVTSALRIHTLIMAITFYTMTGSSKQAVIRLNKLHEILDSSALDGFPDGFLTIPLPSGPPLVLQITHPRTLYDLTYLISSVAKRDAVGRRPKKKVFAAEGLKACESPDEVKLPAWAGLREAHEIEERLAKIKADLLCELASVCIMRSEFDEAEKHLAEVIAHTRTFSLFPHFAARITLHYAHLFHALGVVSRALECYRAAAYLAEHDSFVNVAARAGEVGLRIGLGQADDADPEDLEEMREDVVVACRKIGGTLQAVGKVLEACGTEEIVRAKQHLKAALDIASASQDNYLRALILAMTSAHYMHTATSHAEMMLKTCRQLASGLGASDARPSRAGADAEAGVEDVIGNAPLGLWVGERFLELYRRLGKPEKAQRQEAANDNLAKAVQAISERCSDGLGISEPQGDLDARAAC